MARKYRMRKGSIVKTLKRIRPWGPTRLKAIPAGTRGVVIRMTTTMLEKHLVWAETRWSWRDSQGKQRSYIWVVAENDRNIRVLKY